MPIVTIRSVILKTYPYSETSKILRLMTLEHGPRSAIAKGARRPGSKFGGLIESFAEGDATLYLKENRDLHTLSDFDLIRERQGLGADLGRFTGASVLCELVMRLAPEHRDERLYRLLTAGLDALVAAPADAVDAVALRAIWRTVSTLGFAPDLVACLACGRTIADSEKSRFDLAAGGLRCIDCASEGARGPDQRSRAREPEPRDGAYGDGDGSAAGGVRLAPGELTTLRALSGAGAAPPDDARGVDVSYRQRKLLVDFVRYHLAEGLNLRSLRFLLEGSPG